MAFMKRESTAWARPLVATKRSRREANEDVLEPCRPGWECFRLLGSSRSVQAITLHVDHGRLGNSSWRDLMLQDASAGGHAHRDLNGPLDVGIVRIGGDRAGPCA